MSCNCHDYENCETEEKEDNKLELVLNILGIVIFLIPLILKLEGVLGLLLYILSYVLIGHEIILNAFKSLFKKTILDENFLMVIATVGAFFIGQYEEGIAVLLFYKAGEYLQDKAVEKSKKQIKSSIAIKPEYANIKNGEEIKRVNPKKLNVGDVIVVKAGEKIPVDGVIIKGNSSLDMSVLTGESLPREVKVGEEVLSGSININGLLEIEVTKTFENSTISKILDLIENASSRKSSTENFITKFAKVYTPIVVVIAILIAIVPSLFFGEDPSEFLRRALIFLVVSCPCALVLSIPLGYFCGIGKASKHGILIKGSNYLDELSNMDTILFDKTGTLTKGVFTVVERKSINGLRDEEVLEYIALLEGFSNHYIAKSIVKAYGKEVNQARVSNHEEIAGYGIKARIDDKEALAGNSKLLDLNGIKYEVQEKIGTVIYLSLDREYKGYIVLADELKQDSKKAIKELKDLGIKNIVMLTGDNKKPAEKISEELGLDKVYSELLPDNKVSILEEIKNERQGKIAYVGDGINDSPVLAMADIGISMGKGSDIAIESSDIVLMTDEPSKIAKTIKISKKTKRIVMQNIIFAISVKIIFLVLSGFGETNMWEAVFADVGVSIIAVLNALRIMRK